MPVAASGGTMRSYEKLGLFYLGKIIDPRSGALTDEYLLYDSRDLLTHAVCVGMTGSGKTGLGIALLEEAAIDGIPVIAIDPKGDLGNLLLAFPDLAPADFRPWIDEDEARRRGMSPDDFARNEAERWRRGLAEWDQDGERIRTLQVRLLRARERQAREQEQYQEQKAAAAISLGSTLLGALIGRRAISTGTLGRATTTARQASRISRQKQDIQLAEEEAEALRRQLEEIEDQLRRESDRLSLALESGTEALEEILIRPTKADILLQACAIFWVPFLHSPDGRSEPLFAPA